MGERGFDDLARELGCLARPIAEAGTKAMGRYLPKVHAFQYRRKGHVARRAAWADAWEHEAVWAGKRANDPQQFNATICQWYPVLSPRLHEGGRDRPEPGNKIEFIPPCAPTSPDLAAVNSRNSTARAAMPSRACRAGTKDGTDCHDIAG